MAGPSNPHDLTLLLQAWRSGDGTALDRLIPQVYEELHRLAHRYMQHERAGHVLQTTALVDEAYLQLIEVKKVNWQDRAHFFAICAKLMRQILIHMARSRSARKRGGRALLETLDEGALVGSEPDANLIAIDEALQALEEVDPRKAKVVELRFFGGMTAEETAEALDISIRTVEREWRAARARLHKALTVGEHDES